MIVKKSNLSNKNPQSENIKQSEREPHRCRRLQKGQEYVTITFVPQKSSDGSRSLRAATTAKQAAQQGSVLASVLHNSYNI